MLGSLPDSTQGGSPLLPRTKWEATHPDQLRKEEGEAKDWGKGRGKKTETLDT
jgi:hypothetical protein